MRRLNLKSLNRQARAAREGKEYVPGCTGKMQYASAEAAKDVISRRKQEGEWRHLTTYKCRGCAQWHITHSRQ